MESETWVPEGEHGMRETKKVPLRMFPGYFTRARYGESWVQDDVLAELERGLKA